MNVICSRNMWCFEGFVGTKTLTKIPGRTGGEELELQFETTFTKNFYSEVEQGNQIKVCADKGGSEVSFVFAFMWEISQHVCMLMGKVQWLMWLIWFCVSIIITHLILLHYLFSFKKTVHLNTMQTLRSEAVCNSEFCEEQTKGIKRKETMGKKTAPKYFVPHNNLSWNIYLIQGWAKVDE